MKPRIYYERGSWRVAPCSRLGNDWFHAWIFCDHMNLGVLNKARRP